MWCCGCTLGIRLIEALILGLIAVITGCFLVELVFANRYYTDLFGVDSAPEHQSLYVAMGILGATVMPHNLYLHSALVQTRRIGQDHDGKSEACRFNFLDSVIALNGALIVNGAILVMSAAVFFKHGIVVTQIEQAQQLLAPLLGPRSRAACSAVALLASGQASTMTGTSRARS